jgi:CRISPR-associated protein Cmr5
LTRIILKIIDRETKEESLLRYVINSKEDIGLLKEKIKDASIAIKLAIRTFEFKKA